LECLKYLREHGHHWDSGTCDMPPREDIWSV
jgi:hypothetical protein